MTSFFILCLLCGNLYFVKPKEIEMPVIYAEKVK